MIKKICFYIFLFFCLILNFILDFNIKNYIDILNKCFNSNIVLNNNLYILICVVIAIILIFIELDVLLVFHKGKIENKGIKFKTDDGTYGTADWMQEKEIEQILGFDKTPGIILGKYNNRLVILPFESYFNKNICMFGNSR